MRTVGAIEAIGFVGHAHLLHHSQAGARHVQQGVFFRRVHGHAVLAAHGGVYKLDVYVVADSIDVAVAPLFKRVGGSGSATFFERPFVGAAGGVGLNFIGRAVDDIDAATIGFPTGDAGRKTLVGVGDAPVVFFLELVFFGIGSRVATEPELFDELLALIVGAEAFPSLLFLIRDDVGNVLIEPLFVGSFELFAQLFFLFAALSVGHGLGDGLALRGIRGGFLVSLS